MFPIMLNFVTVLVVASSSVLADVVLAQVVSGEGRNQSNGPGSTDAGGRPKSKLEIFTDHLEQLDTSQPHEVDPYETDGIDPNFDPYRMPLGGMTNLHHPMSCTRKRNAHPRWLYVRNMVNRFLEYPYGEHARMTMLGPRWNLSQCDCTCGSCGTYLQECPLGHLIVKWLSFFGTTGPFRAMVVFGNVAQTTADYKKEDFNVLENYGSNILFMIRANWGSYYVMQSGWPIYDILLRLSQQLSMDNYPLVKHIRVGTPKKIEEEMRDAVELNGGSLAGLSFGHIGYLSARALSRAHHPTWFVCNPASDDAVLSEIDTLKHNLYLRDLVENAFGWYLWLDRIDHSWWENAAAEILKSSTIAGTQMGFYREDGVWIKKRKKKKFRKIVYEMDGINVSNAETDWDELVPLKINDEQILDEVVFGDRKRNKKAEKMFDSYVSWGPYSRMRLSRQHLHASNYTAKAPAFTFWDHKLAFLDSHQFAARVIDLDEADHQLEYYTPERNLLAATHSMVRKRKAAFEVDDIAEDTKVNGGRRVVVEAASAINSGKPKGSSGDAKNKVTIRNRGTSWSAATGDDGKQPNSLHFDWIMEDEMFNDKIENSKAEGNQKQVDYLVKQRKKRRLAQDRIKKSQSVLHWKGSPRIVHEPRNVIWRVNINHDRLRKPGFVDTEGPIENSQIASKFFDPEVGYHFSKRGKVVSSALKGDLRRQIEKQHWEGYFAKKKLHLDDYDFGFGDSDSLNSPKSLKKMASIVKDASKYLMPSCALQQAVAMAEYLVEAFLRVDLGAINKYGDNIFEVPDEEMNPYNYQCKKPRGPDGKPAPEKETEHDVNIREEFMNAYGKSENEVFVEKFNMTREEWKSKKLKIPLWRDIIKTRIQEVLELDVLAVASKSVGGKEYIRRKIDAFPEKRMQQLLRRVEVFFMKWLAEIDLLLHNWARFYRTSFFGALVALPEARRLLKALSVIQKSLVQEYYCAKSEPTAVSFQGEWKVEALVINLFASGVGFNFVEETKRIQEKIPTKEENLAVVREISERMSMDSEEGAKKAAEEKFRQHKKRGVDVAESQKKLYATRVSTRFAFVGVMFDNSEVDTYIRALRVVARSVYRLHAGKYPFVILTPDNLLKSTEAKLCRQPDYNLRVFRVGKEMVASRPNFGVDADAGPIEWWTERGTHPTAVGFYRWNLTMYEKLIFLDADVLVTRPIDELFQVRAHMGVGVTPFATFRMFLANQKHPYLNIGVMVIKPSTELFQTLMVAVGNPESKYIKSDRLAKLFEKGLQQPWLDQFFLKNSVRMGYVRFEPTGVETYPSSRLHRKQFYFGDDNELDDRNYENSEEFMQPMNSTKTATLFHKTQTAPPDDTSDSNDVPLTFTGCDEHFATRWQHGPLADRGTLLTPDTAVVSLHPTTWQDIYDSDANSIARVYFHKGYITNETQIRQSLDHQGFSEHLMLPYHCVLPMEYNFFVEYKTSTQLMDMIWNEHLIQDHKNIQTSVERTHNATEQLVNGSDINGADMNGTDKVVNGTNGTLETPVIEKFIAGNKVTEVQYYSNLQLFAEETRFNMTRDLVTFTQMTLPPKVLHWAGENRKPWERIHPLVRSHFDNLWWQEHDAMVAELQDCTVSKP